VRISGVIDFDSILLISKDEVLVYFLIVHEREVLNIPGNAKIRIDIGWCVVVLFELG
jgi:hypothetical protein